MREILIKLKWKIKQNYGKITFQVSTLTIFKNNWKNRDKVDIIQLLYDSQINIKVFRQQFLNFFMNNDSNKVLIVVKFDEKIKFCKEKGKLLIIFH